MIKPHFQQRKWGLIVPKVVDETSGYFRTNGRYVMYSMTESAVHA